jgi:hypothetical protein
MNENEKKISIKRTSRESAPDDGLPAYLREAADALISTAGVLSHAERDALLQYLRPRLTQRRKAGPGRPKAKPSLILRHDAETGATFIEAKGMTLDQEKAAAILLLDGPDVGDHRLAKRLGKKGDSIRSGLQGKSMKRVRALTGAMRELLKESLPEPPDKNK